jgi:dipeptidyl aminopeptidase/acylaminoacyl peptidase
MLLLLHGENDNRFSPKQAEAFAQKLITNGVPVQIKIFPNTGHFIPDPDQYAEIYSFLEKYLH